MTTPIVVQIVGAPIACAKGCRESWRDTANWAAGQLKQRFGDAVRVEYFDLFDPQCPRLPPDAQIPLIFIEGVVISSGSKIPMPAIRKRLEALLAEAR